MGRSEGDLTAACTVSTGLSSHMAVKFSLISSLVAVLVISVTADLSTEGNDVLDSNVELQSFESDLALQDNIEEVEDVKQKREALPDPKKKNRKDNPGKKGTGKKKSSKKGKERKSNKETKVKREGKKHQKRGNKILRKKPSKRGNKILRKMPSKRGDQRKVTKKRGDRDQENLKT